MSELKELTLKHENRCVGSLSPMRAMFSYGPRMSELKQLALKQENRLWSLKSAVPEYPPVQFYIRQGAILAALFFGMGCIWSAAAPVPSASMAPGMVKVDGSRKTVQHLEGGIIREILIRDGEAVKEGQVLVRLDNTDALAELNMIQGQIEALEAETSAMREQLP